ncbi:EIN3-binding F-box 1-like [Olea europaea subsp. europaea]|uniref:EIN3-binding F-box 1-like n=1 Tax=Olea europaea subsp. europaea TaxID=158383 RepID=A0A8S0R4Q8_OLEEU|nr:EIN3-binding F-box 1-like [Olea europaea subsp. europaea]
MSKVLNFSGDDDLFPGGFLFPNSKEPSLYLSLGHHVDMYVPPRKRSRVTAPFIVCREQKQQPSIEVLPDECLFEVFRRLPGGQERSACAGVSKRWLMLLSSIQRDEICNETTRSVEPENRSNIKKADESVKSKDKGGFVDSNGIRAEVEEDSETGVDGYLSRCLEGKKATDVRLAAIAVGTGSRGGLGKLSIRESSSTRGLTDFGLKAIARGCPSLRELSIWHSSSIGDEGLLEIANGCHLLEKLDLCHCSAVTDKCLLAIAKNCPNLASVTIESCSNIGNESLQTLGRSCHNLKSVTVKHCPLVGDQGIAGLFSSAGNVVTKVKLQALNISDVSLAVIGHYGSALTDLALIGLQNVNERGFWAMASGQSLQKLKSLAITTCRGVSDLGLEAIGKGCPNLHQVCLRRCPLVSDKGLISFAKAAGSLENLQLEECHRITHSGVFGIFANCGGKLKALALANCFGIQNMNFLFPLTFLCYSLRSLTICNCPGFGNASLAMVGKLCPYLTHVDFIGLQGITDAGLLSFVQSSEAGLMKVNLSGCVNLTDNVVATISKLHGSTLEVLNLEGCRFITDASLVTVARDCWQLNELDVSSCGITDSGIAILAGAKQLNLQILSLAGCSLVSDKSAPLLVVMGKTLMGLNLQHCHGISSGAVDLLVEQLWRCDILS